MFCHGKSFQHGLVYQLRSATPDSTPMASPYTFVGGKAPSPVIVIVNGRQVIVDQGVGMDHLHGCRKRLCRLLPSPEHLIGFQQQHGAKAFSPGRHAVVHSLCHMLRKPGFRREIVPYQALYFFSFLLQFLLKIQQMFHPHSSAASFFHGIQLLAAVLQKLHALFYTDQRNPPGKFPIPPVSQPARPAPQKLPRSSAASPIRHAFLFLSDAAHLCLYGSVGDGDRQCISLVYF